MKIYYKQKCIAFPAARTRRASYSIEIFQIYTMVTLRRFSQNCMHFAPTFNSLPSPYTIEKKWVKTLLQEVDIVHRANIFKQKKEERTVGPGFSGRVSWKHLLSSINRLNQRRPVDQSLQKQLNKSKKSHWNWFWWETK